MLSARRQAGRVAAPDRTSHAGAPPARAHARATPVRQGCGGPRRADRDRGHPRPRRRSDPAAIAMLHGLLADGCGVRSTTRTFTSPSFGRPCTTRALGSRRPVRLQRNDEGRLRRRPSASRSAGLRAFCGPSPWSASIAGAGFEPATSGLRGARILQLQDPTGTGSCSPGPLRRITSLRQPLSGGNTSGSSQVQIGRASRHRPPCGTAGTGPGR